MQHPGGGVGLAVEAWNRDLTQKIAAGNVAAVDNTVDPSSGTVRIKATFPNEDNALFPNQFVNARLLVNTLEKATIVPAAAVQHGPNNLTFTYVVKGDQTVEMRNIVTGPTEGDLTAIKEGVAPGDMVVTDGVDKLQNGSKVEVRKPAATTQPVRPSTRSIADALAE
jgi:multidrug efflux system membrane fusion protein